MQGADTDGRNGDGQMEEEVKVKKRCRCVVRWSPQQSKLMNAVGVSFAADVIKLTVSDGFVIVNVDHGGGPYEVHLFNSITVESAALIEDPNGIPVKELPHVN